MGIGKAPSIGAADTDVTPVKKKSRNKTRIKILKNQLFKKFILTELPILPSNLQKKRKESHKSDFSRPSVRETSYLSYRF